MKVVGIKQLKTHLSEYIRLVKSGEVVLVSDRDAVVAELRQPRLMTRDAVTDPLEALVAAREVAAPELAKGDWIWRPTSANLPKGTAKRLLDEIRSDEIRPDEIRSGASHSDKLGE